MSIIILDTSIVCNIVRIPGKYQNYDEVIHSLREFIQQGFTLLLPMATIIETGNHVAQNGDGNQRRQTAERFVEVVNGAIKHEAPWTIPNPLFSPEDLAEYLVDFPDNAMRKIGLGDLSIVKEFEHQCKLHSDRRVFIWSIDEHLGGYDRQAPEWVGQ